MNSKVQIGILGVGAIGTVIAYFLQKKSSHELSYFSRTKKEHLNLITNDIRHHINIKTNTSISKAHQLDWLIICLKAHQYNAANHWFTKLIQPNTKVVVIRNGLRLKEPILGFTTKENILECIIDCPTEQLKQRTYKTIRKPQLTLPKSNLAINFKSLFDTSEIGIQQVKDFKTKSWEKLCKSATIGAILCLHNDTCKVFKSKNLKQQYEELMNETIQIAVADGAKMEADFLEKTWIEILNYPDTKGSSMLTDLRNNNSLELEAKNGMISKLGKLYNIKTPINDDFCSRYK